MLMLCWFYCIPFAILLYFALGPIMAVFSLFMLKRGVRQGRRGLKQWAFALLFSSGVKTFIFDLQTKFAQDYLFCTQKMLPIVACEPDPLRKIKFAGIVALVIFSYILLHYYQRLMPDRKPKIYTPEDVNLRFWANLGLVSVFAMIIWTMAPWVGALTVGGVPKLFMIVKWQHFAIGNVLLLLIGFWKVESCSWEYKSGDKESRKRVSGGWSPRDTLWLNVFLYLITLALSYVAHDILTGVYKR